MTTGNTLSDFRYNDAEGHVKSLGQYASKSWSGGDSTSPSARFSKQAKGKWPGYWLHYLASRSSFWNELPLKHENGSFHRGNFRETTRRLRQVRYEYSLAMANYLRDHETYLALKKQEAKHRGEEHPYRLTLIRSLDTPCSYRQLLTSWQSWHTGVAASAVFGNQVSIPNIWSSNDDNALIEKLRSKLNGVPGFHAGVAVAELERTCKMFSGAATTLRKFGERMGRGDLRGSLSTLFYGEDRVTSIFNSIPRSAQLFLGLNFGLLPLLDDVKGAAQMLGWQAGIGETPMRIRVRREIKKSVRSSNPVIMGWERTERGQIIALLSAKPNAADFSGLTDVASILWERQWMSFVVDWWFPVGSALSAFQMAQTLQGRFVTTRTTRDTRSSYSSGSGYASYQIIGDSSYYRKLFVDRTVSSSLIPKMPKLRPILHPKAAVAIKHTLEAGALMIVNAGAIRRGVRALDKLSRDSAFYTE